MSYSEIRVDWGRRVDETTESVDDYVQIVDTRNGDISIGFTQNQAVAVAKALVQAQEGASVSGSTVVWKQCRATCSFDVLKDGQWHEMEEGPAE